MAAPKVEIQEGEPVPAAPTSSLSRPWRRTAHVASIMVLAAVYYIAARAGLRLAFVNASATPVWPATGIALASLLLFGYELWPGIFLGAWAANLATAGTVAASLGIATGNTLEGLVGAYLVTRFAGGKRAFERAPDVARFFVIAGVLSTTVSATIGTITVALGGLAQWRDATAIWLTWWLGDAGGNIVVAPLLLLWAVTPRVHWRRLRVVEAFLLLTTLSLTALLVFNGSPHPAIADHPLEFICTPFLVWVAYRFGPREAATAILVLASIATAGTLQHRGPFWRGTPNESLLLLQAFNGVSALMSLVLAAVVRERRLGEDQLRRLAVTDALTGLANYRQLMDVIDSEIQRSRRTGRTFAILFLDLDDLKKINDHHGHLVGSNALVRVARALTTLSRAIDTAARFGGDEFALVLPESDEDAARHVAWRISSQLADDGQVPTISVCIGVAVYPRDGRTAESLLGAADALLYQLKSTVHAEGGRTAHEA